ncbi:hypothetical protein CesoFtcFv8_009392 [Champsocephalus esox]|uniref:Uncharacterized protein n=1 Tax=Champsocephalus esox TaxID=159716 RepID=A0AAN8H1M7_9TELE|nr:hypothetical protein CesoFtcFv8_009392 [Champsocephalus esox]
MVGYLICFRDGKKDRKSEKRNEMHGSPFLPARQVLLYLLSLGEKQELKEMKSSCRTGGIASPLVPVDFPITH